MNRCRWPSTTRRSFTRGAATGIGPTPVVTVRGRAVPLRTTTAWPAASRSLRCRLTYSSTSTCNATSIIRRAPSRASSSNVPRTAPSVSTAVRPVISSSIGGVPFSPALTGVLGLTSSTSPEGYVAFSLHPQLPVIAPSNSGNAGEPDRGAGSGQRAAAAARESWLCEGHVRSGLPI